MQLDEKLLEILVCPEDRSPLKVASDHVIANLNQQIQNGCLKNRKGDAIGEKIEGGLVRADGKYLYPVRENIPVILIDESIALN